MYYTPKRLPTVSSSLTSTWLDWGQKMFRARFSLIKPPQSHIGPCGDLALLSYLSKSEGKYTLHFHVKDYFKGNTSHFSALGVTFLVYQGYHSSFWSSFQSCKMFLMPVKSLSSKSKHWARNCPASDILVLLKYVLMIEKSKLASSFNQSCTRFSTTAYLTHSDNEDRNNAVACQRTGSVTQTSAFVVKGIVGGLRLIKVLIIRKFSLCN